VALITVDEILCDRKAITTKLMRPSLFLFYNPMAGQRQWLSRKMRRQLSENYDSLRLLSNSE
jgi:hypothetical protein